MLQAAGQNATSGFLPGSIEPWAERLGALRPWGNRQAVRALLEELAPRVGTDGAEAVAEQLGMIGQARNLNELGPNAAAGVAFHLLRNVAAGRDVLDYEPPIEVIGIAERTWRRWRRNWPRAMELFQYDLDVAALVQAGRTRSAARRHLQRNRR